MRASGPLTRVTVGPVSCGVLISALHVYRDDHGPQTTSAAVIPQGNPSHEVNHYRSERSLASRILFQGVRSQHHGFARGRLTLRLEAEKTAGGGVFISCPIVTTLLTYGYPSLPPPRCLDLHVLSLSVYVHSPCLRTVRYTCTRVCQVGAKTT